MDDYPARLRPLRATDLDRIVELERILFGRGAWTYGMLTEELRGLGRWYVVAEPDPPDAVGPQPVVGYAGLWFDGDVSQVMTIGVAPEAQHRGVGSRLMDALIEQSRRLGAEALLLEVRVDNEAALAMYAKYGFECVRVRKRYYQPEDVDAYTMRLPLEPLDAEDPTDADADAAAHVPSAVDAKAADGPAGADDAQTDPADVPTRARVLVAARELAGADPRPVLLDVRWELGRTDGREQFLHGHIPGATYVDLDGELAGVPSTQGGRHPLPDPEALQAAARRWGVRSGSPVVVYDATGGMAAARAWWLLRWAGHRDVRILDGGLPAWQAAGLPVESGEPVPPPPGDFAVQAGSVAVLDADGAADIAGSGILLDARAGERFRGETEPVDARAGHIPGAVSAPTAGNLAAETATFLPDEQLRARFAALGIVPGGPAVGVYCGSGVTAAHEVAALAAVGIEAALFPGSWSQWAADPERPVATGE